MNNEKSCAFFGHRKIDNSKNIKEQLMYILENLIKNQGYRIFLFGGFGDFDKLCHEVVSALKLKYTYLKRIYFLTDVRFLSKSINNQKNEYEEFVYPDLKYDYWYTRIYFRNREIINRSDFVIFYANKIETSGAYKALKYAKKIKRKFYNLYDNI